MNVAIQSTLSVAFLDITDCQLLSTEYLSPQSQYALTVARQPISKKKRERPVLLTMTQIGQTEDSVNVRVYRGLHEELPSFF
jgi:hypothetical protein